MSRPSGGMSMLSTIEVSTFPKAVAMITATARSMTFPLNANSLNSLISPTTLSFQLIDCAPMIRQIAVIGTGTMGRGIAYLSVLAGFDTIIFDLDTAALDVAKGLVDSLLKKGVEKGKVSERAASEAIARVQVAAD